MTSDGMWLTDAITARRDPDRAADRRADLGRRLFGLPEPVEADSPSGDDDEPPGAA